MDGSSFCKSGVHPGLCFSKYSCTICSIGINKIDAMLKQPNGPFVLYAGSKKWVKRKEFEACIRSKLII